MRYNILYVVINESTYIEKYTVENKDIKILLFCNYVNYIV